MMERPQPLSTDVGWESRSRRLLAAAGVALASSLDYATTLDTVARLAVDDMAEWCGLDVLSPDGGLERVSVAHADPARVEWARAFQAKYPTSLSEDAGLAHVLRSGEPVLVSEVTDEMLVASARSPEHLADTRSIGVGSAIIAPLAARGRVLGAISLVHSERGRFGPRDLDLAMDLGRLAGLALENARLYTKAQREIEDRRRAEAALRESEARFRELANAMPVMVWTTEPGVGNIFTNRYYSDYTGTSDEGRGESGWATVVHPDDRARASASYGTAHATHVPWQEELRLRRHDGQYRWHLSRAVPALDETGVPARWYGTSTDIHEQRTLAEELERRVDARTRELTEANRELEAFAYSVAHDLRAPLRAIVSTSHILLDETGDCLGEEHLAMLHRQETNARRLADLIDALLSLARVARQEIQSEPLDLTAIARKVAGDLALESVVAVEDGLTAEGDPRLVRQVFENLLDNARKYSPESCEIRVEGRDGAIAVTDRGIGFDMAYAAKLFLPFERLVEEGRFAGTGIGLATVERIVRRHGGRVWARSEPGAGSTFFFTLSP